MTMKLVMVDEELAYVHHIVFGKIHIIETSMIHHLEHQHRSWPRARHRLYTLGQRAYGTIGEAVRAIRLQTVVHVEGRFEKAHALTELYQCTSTRVREVLF